jgi:hypothetical protein
MGKLSDALKKYGSKAVIKGLNEEIEKREKMIKVICPLCNAVFSLHHFEFESIICLYCKKEINKSELIRR